MKRITANQFQTLERYYKPQKSCLRVNVFLVRQYADHHS